MTVFVYILALAAYIFFSYLWIVGGWFSIAGDYSITDQWKWSADEGPALMIVMRTVILFYVLSIPALVVLGAIGTMAYF